MLKYNYLKIGFLLVLTGFIFFMIQVQPVSANETANDLNADEEYVDNEYVEKLDGIIINGESSEEVIDEGVSPEKGMLYGISSFWEIYSKTKTANSYGPWNVGTSSKKSNASGTLSYSRSFTSSNSYSGTLKVPKSKLDASVGFNVTKSTTATSSYSVNVKKNKAYTIYYRRVYTNYKVKQRYKNINTWTGQVYYNNYANVYPKKYSHIQFKAVEK
ncbi:hypothetical protein HCJ02_02825 [Listeria seeligeri]|nr:hypothetical protein [Listeria seeligeri]MBC1774756.1 hypothetical protein [Listeria seeligeri]MBC1840275.1 hypothetical protein [Listeria seeligeri]MBC2235160.1 hypothetical protein [Listeria seeligeri]MBC6120031.1 hypothetical protein [Listeria seeligeri]MBC6143130.1 hypothetical protein [Listeria seeligeri]